jgi:peptide/nickel transport system ATP-binding protein
VSALDVSVQAQVLNLLQDLQTSFDLTYLFIAHDLSVVKHISDRVAVMYLGKIVELADTTELFARPKHPYTEALLSAVLRPTLSDRGRRERIRLPGDVADASALNEGCPFHPRCRHRRALCETTAPPLVPIATDRHVACHFADELVLMGSTEFVEERAEGR